MGGEKVDGTLSPSGALYHQHPVPTLHKGLNGLMLTISECGIGPASQLSKGVMQLIRSGHKIIVAEGCDPSNQLWCSGLWKQIHGPLGIFKTVA